MAGYRPTLSLARLPRLAAALLACAACHRPGSSGAPAPADQAAGDSAAAADSARHERPRRGERPSRSDAADDSEWSGSGVTRVEELFVGRFPGVQVFQTPQGISVRIRGTTSVRGSNEPLYVIDGFPIDAGPGGLVALNPADVARIEVLKDAGSTAQYGIRGANGVVLITAKRNR
jgi:TonB-dependent SusC/RagA subfamily outer membrane receptor